MRYDAEPIVPAIDAGVVDAAMAGRSTRGEIVTGAGRLEGGRVKMNVQIGHSTDQSPASGGNATVEGAAVVK